jgi:stage V sporulation protein SpoVS
MAVVGIIASRLTRIIGIFTIAIVAAIPLITLANDTSMFLTPDGMKTVSSPAFLQVLVFGTTYAAIGEMVPSFVFSFVIMHFVRDFFLKDGGSHASQYVNEDVVKSVQENVFSYEQPTSS